MHRTDEEIVKEVLAGRKQQYAKIVTRYQQPVFNLMLRYTRNEPDAADLTQDVFLRAFRRLSTFRTDGSLFSWLYALAVNVANDWSRSQTRTVKGHDSFDRDLISPAGIESAREHIENREREQLLEKALDMLSPDTREMLVLRYRHEQPFREVATIFGMTESAIKMRVKRGLEQLQKILTEANSHGY